MSDEINMAPIPGYETRYLVSKDGKVYSLLHNPPKLLKPSFNSRTGYESVGLYGGIKRKQPYVHRLVAITFIPNPLGLREVDHIDANKQHNHVDNLEWCSPSTNTKRAVELGLTSHGRIAVNVTLLITGTLTSYISLKEAAKATRVSVSTISKYRKLYGKEFVIGDYKFEILTIRRRDTSV